jgi:hypothetical protein
LDVASCILAALTDVSEVIITSIMRLLITLMVGEAINTSETVGRFLPHYTERYDSICCAVWPHAYGTPDIACEKKVLLVHPRSRCYNDDVWQNKSKVGAKFLGTQNMNREHKALDKLNYKCGLWQFIWI